MARTLFFLFVLCGSFTSFQAQLQELRLSDSGFFGAVFERNEVSSHSQNNSSNEVYDPPLDAIILNVLPDSPAQKAGFLPQDMIIAVNGKGVNGSQRFIHFLAQQKPATRLHCIVLRVNPETEVEETLKLEVLLGEFSETSPGLPPLFGLECVLSENQKVKIKKVASASAGAFAQLRKDYILVEFDGKKLETLSPQELHDFFLSFDTQRLEPVPVKALVEETLQNFSIQPLRRGYLGFWFSPDSEGKPIIGEIIPESPASLAELYSGDLIVKIDEEAIPHYQKVGLLVKTKGKGTTFQFEILRGSQTLQKSITLAGMVGY
jgi:membrane-associated protease RseP (regulator of RpoE activity)